MPDPAATPEPASARPSGDLPGRDPLLPPTESLNPDEFEDFTERLLNAHKYAGADVLRTVRVVRWGRRGDPQDGIDFAGELSDGSSASWQCKRYDTWSVAETREAIKKDTYGADVHHLVLSCEASTPVRREMRRHPTWRLLDKRGLQQLLEDLPHAKRRDVLDDTFGTAVRRRLMATPGQDNIVSLDSFAADRLDEDTILNDLGRFVGRQREMDELVTALAPDAAGPHVIVVAGPGGRGKSRLLLEALQQVESRHPQRAVVLLAEGVPLTAELRAELPGVSAVVVVDDAHQHPEPLRALMSYARQVPGTQVVLGCRPSGHQAVMDILTERHSLGNIRVIDVDELRLGEARTLVNSLADGLGLSWPYREQLAHEATHSPHVAVIAVNLIRRGQMTRAPIVDPSLRQHVLGRYKDVTAGMVSGIDSERIGALMAIYAALHGVRDGDDRAEQHIRDLTGLSRRELSRARGALRDRGVLLTRNGTTVVVPEVLGDQALEDQAAIDGDDTGFATEVWEHFGPFEGPRLIASLAWLDWRLTQRGGPSVLSGIWEDLRRRLLLGDLDDVQHDLRSLDSLASTHPAPFLGLLEELRERLTAPARTTTSSTLQDADVAQLSPLAQMRRQLFHRPPAQPFEVLQALAPLYGRCAAHDPALLEQALEALWALRQLPHQLGETRSERPERVVADVLGDLGGLPDPSFPLRIVAVVKRWLNEPAQPSVQLSPLFMLHSLLDKQGTVTEQSDHKTLELGGYFVSASWAAPLRQRLRALLLSQATGASPRRAAEAVHLLSRMLQPLHSSFGNTISEEEERSWGEDELATIATLAEATQATTSSALRRTIRHDVSWSAEHAHLTATRHAAMVLVTELDQRGEDDLAEALLPGWYGGLAHRRGLRAPTLEDVTSAREAEDVRAGATVEQQALRQEFAAEERRRQRRETAELVWSRAAAALQGNADTAAMVTALDAAARDAAEVLSHNSQRPQLTALYAKLAEAEPARLPELVQTVADGAEGPLDADLERLLEAWRHNDPPAFLGWLRGMRGQRPAVRQAVARGWQRFRWAETDPASLSAFDDGVADQDQAVQHAFLQASFQRHPHEAGRAAQLLLDAAAPAQVCETALQIASSEDVFAWGKALSEPDGQVVLSLIDRAGWGDWTLQHIAAGIAINHPMLVLEHLVQREATIGYRVDPGSLPAALEGQAARSAQWLVTRCPALTDAQLQHIADAAFEPGVGQGIAGALQGHMAGADADSLVAVADCLRHVSLWPVRRPDLARVMVRRADELGEPARQRLLERLSAGMRMHGTMFADGVSKELQTAHALCDEVLVDEENPVLKQLLTDARTGLAQQMASGLLAHEGDE